MVVNQHDDQLDALLERGHDLAVEHQVGPVAHQRKDLTIGRGHLDAQGAGDLVPHAGVALLDVVLLRIASPPQFVQVARHRAGGADDDVTRTGRIVDRADDFALGGQRLMRQLVKPADLLIPFQVEARGLLATGGIDLVPLQPAGQRLDARAGIGDERDRAVLGGVEVQHVQVDEANVRVGEDRVR